MFNQTKTKEAAKVLRPYECPKAELVEVNAATIISASMPTFHVTDYDQEEEVDWFN